jgi:fructose-1-phosphate kinase PfkB-like protein
MLAGLLARIDAAPFDDALRWGTALAAADAESPVAGRPDPKRAEVLLADVALREIAEAS